MGKKKISLLTLCDLSKAFDSVYHSVLVKICTKLNVDSYWFNSYLRDRTQSVKLNAFTSNKANVDFGVPQGSILGPILFSVYVNDTAEYITERSLVQQYPDDTQFLQYDSIGNLYNIIEKAEITLVKAKEYFLKKGLMINPS